MDMQDKDGISKDKVLRVFDINKRLMDGESINKAFEANNYNINERSIRRDIDDINIFLAEETDKTGIIQNTIF